MHDIVYFLKDTKVNEELRYSLRTLHNFPHRKVWFYGGCPTDLIPDKHVYIIQDQENKWKNVNLLLKHVSRNKNITKNFWLFNDDFFIMEKIEKPINYYNGDMYKRIVTLEDCYNGITPYSQLLRDTCKELESLGCTTKNYALHIPMLLNRDKLTELFMICDFHGFRSLYGNYFNIATKQMKDVKITGKNKLYKGGCYLSTDDNSFNGAVGEQIRHLFPDKCKYEK